MDPSVSPLDDNELYIIMKNIGDFLKKNNIIRVLPDDSLSEALGQLSSSHDAAFIVDENDVFQGVINPYYALIQSTSYDGNTKVSRAVYHPPKIHASDTLSRISEMMVTSKIHYLPVFAEDESFVGITSARRLLSLMKKSVEHIPLSKLLVGKTRDIIAVKETATISDALHTFQNEKISKLIVVDSHEKLIGILSYYDLIPYLIAPSERVEKGNDKVKPFEKLLVKNYMKRTLAILDSTAPVSEAIETILEKKMGSIIITDTENHPVNIITTRDILGLLKTDSEKKEVKVTIKNFNPAHKIILDEFTEHVTQHIMLNEWYERAEIIVNEEREGVLFHIAVHLIPHKGKMIIFERETKDLPELLKNLKEMLRRDK